MENKRILSWTMTIVRIVIGWHLLYEGISKLTKGNWSAAPYLSESRWIFSDVFHAIVNHPVLLNITDNLNMFGLSMIGLALILGIFTRVSAICGALLMFLYYIAYPPFLGYTQGVVVEGSYLWVNRNLIEFAVLVLIAVFSSKEMFGLDRLYKNWAEAKIHKPIPKLAEPAVNSGLRSFGQDRRDTLRNLISMPIIGAFSYALYRKNKFQSWEEKFLQSNPKKTDATSGATLMNFSYSSLQNLKTPCPKGKIGNLEISRLIAGGNLIGGWAHSRDLLYVSKLVKAYHSDDKVIQTLSLAEKCGVNTLLCNPSLARIVHKYWAETGGKIQFISDCQSKGSFLDGIDLSIKYGASACYCGGELTDRYYLAGNYEVLKEGIAKIRAAGLPAGIGAHRIETIKGCVEHGIIPDFWMKTIHNLNYWSAQVDTVRLNPIEEGFMDNIFCANPNETIEYMNKLEQPWIGFKVLAAGSIKPEEGFKFAFEGGADFITVGMYDFQIVDDVNIVTDILPKVKNRKRIWHG